MTPFRKKGLFLWVIEKIVNWSLRGGTTKQSFYIALRSQWQAMIQN